MVFVRVHEVDTQEEFEHALAVVFEKEPRSSGKIRNQSLPQRAQKLGGASLLEEWGITTDVSLGRAHDRGQGAVRYRHGSELHPLCRRG